MTPIGFVNLRIFGPSPVNLSDDVARMPSDLLEDTANVFPQESESDKLTADQDEKDGEQGEGSLRGPIGSEDKAEENKE